MKGVAGAHFEQDVLVGEVRQVGVVLVDELGERVFAGWPLATLASCDK